MKNLLPTNSSPNSSIKSSLNPSIKSSLNPSLTPSINSSFTSFGRAFILGCAITLSGSALMTTNLQAQALEGEALSESLLREARTALDQSAKWLLAKQQEDGHWSNAEYPALTALPVWALSRAGKAEIPAVKKATEWIATHAKEDGSIYVEPSEERKGGGLVNYNTAISMVGLHLSGNPDYTDLVLKARTFTAAGQHLGGDIYEGGMGYDAKTDRAYADLLNTSVAVEAMRLTEGVEDLRPRGEAKADLKWDKVVEFVERIHNDPKVNDNPLVSDDAKEQGGFWYRPDQTRAGEHEGEDGTMRYRSMPGMTYAGLLTYIYADVERDDPRVTSTVKWIANNWNLDEASRDPEKVGTDAAKEGLFYLYNVQAKGLAAFGNDTLVPESGKSFNWRVKLIERLLRSQKTEAETGNGYWLNEDGRYMEGDPILVTSYTMIALANALGPDLEAKK